MSAAIWASEPNFEMLSYGSTSVFFNSFSPKQLKLQVGPRREKLSRPENFYLL